RTWTPCPPDVRLSGPVRPRGVSGPGRSDRRSLEEKLGDLLELDLRGVTRGLDRVVVHHDILGARHYEVVEAAEAGRLGDALLTGPLAASLRGVLHPDPAAARAAAKTAAPVARHLHQLDAAPADELPRLVVDPVETAERARVMVGAASAERVGDLQLAL